MNLLNIGDISPNFTLQNQNGKDVSLSAFRGKYVVLYFYPKDNTPGCTTQGCLFRDYNDVIQEQGGVVLGVSADSIDSHTKFRDKHGFQFDLLSDPDHKVSEMYNTWGEKKIFGKIIQGMRRSTFLIDPNGKIVKIWPKADPKTNAIDALNEIQALKKGSTK
jgi:thioredoxin-dependent peroxiredoxin